jgi:hypothetical protein
VPDLETSSFGADSWRSAAAFGLCVASRVKPTDYRTAMNLDTEADLAPEFALNEIPWKSVRGAASPMPSPSTPPSCSWWGPPGTATGDDDDR